MLETCEVYRLGVMEYARAWRLQAQWAGEIGRGERPPALLLLEHPHAYTFGRQGRPENLVWDEAELARRGVAVHWVDRGGDVTYHGPGQLVGYPLLPLLPGGLKPQIVDGKPRLPQADYVGYLRRLEETLILALASFGIHAGRIEGLTGVWIQPEEAPIGNKPLPAAWGSRPAKIAAIGVKVDVYGVARHGFALNVDPEMRYWEGIVGCGLADHPVACLADLLDPPPDVESVADAVIRAFGKVFGCRMEIQPAERETV